MIATAVFLLLAQLAASKVMKGISYGPMPLKGIGQRLAHDDFMSEDAKPLWARRGRGDLRIMRQLGANTVRLYGNNEEKSHRAFLDEARLEGLDVLPGLSDWPYVQMPGRCSLTGFDCFQQIRDSYLGNLRVGGWLLADGSYHPALQHVVVMNEPELKIANVVEQIRAMASALDGMLEAERLAGVQGRLLNFTVTYSFALCETCVRPVNQVSKPALGQMLELRKGLLDPVSYGYRPRNDISAALKSRFTNSFNTANQAKELDDLFFNDYKQNFPSTPVFIGEFHSPHPPHDMYPDVALAVKMAEESSLFMGSSFFEFQVRYDKGGSEMDFGMFGLGDYKFEDWNFDSTWASSWCLVPVTNAASSQSLPAAVAAAYGGEGVDAQRLCQPNPEQVPLDATGFQTIAALQDQELLRVYVARLVTHSGGKIIDDAGFATFVQAVASFDGITAALASRPEWATWQQDVVCVADRTSDPGRVGLAVQQLCSYFDCQGVPANCKDDLWRTADFAFGAYFREKGGDALANCYFGGAAMLTGESALVNGDVGCFPEAADVPLTDANLQLFRAQGNSTQLLIFATRVVQHVGGQVLDRARLRAIAGAASSLQDLMIAFAPQPPWAAWDSAATCAWDPAGAGSPGLTIEFACSKTKFNCGNVPAQCKGDVWHMASYVVSAYNVENAGAPLPTCLYRGALIFAQVPSHAVGLHPQCVLSLDPASTALTEEGYQAILSLKDAEKMAGFIYRVIFEQMGASLASGGRGETGLKALASSAPATMDMLMASLQHAPWICVAGKVACDQDPALVPLNDQGFQQLRTPSNRQSFAQRVVQHHGGSIINVVAFAQHMGSAASLPDLTTRVQQQPTWATWEEASACRVDAGSRDLAGMASARATVEHTCGQLQSFSCSRIPAQCSSNIWDTADYVLSVHALQKGEDAVAPSACLEANTLVFRKAGREASSCIMTGDPSVTPLTEDGLQMVLLQKDAMKTAGFIRRFASKFLGASVADEAGLRESANSPPQSVQELWALLDNATWLCGGASAAGACDDSVGISWRVWFLGMLAAIAVLTACGAVAVAWYRQSKAPQALPAWTATAGAALPHMWSQESSPLPHFWSRESSALPHAASVRSEASMAQPPPAPRLLQGEAIGKPLPVPVDATERSHANSLEFL